MTVEAVTVQHGNPGTEVARCSGHCCRGFTISVTYETLFEDALKYRGEAEQVFDMLVPLREGIDPRPEMVPPYAPDSPLYTCRHLQANGDCGIYHTRPRMCRDYPYRGRCWFVGCTRRTQRDVTEAQQDAAIAEAMAPRQPPPGFDVVEVIS